MLKFLLNNKNLFKIFKYGKNGVAYLNKHFFLISILAWISGFRKTSYYKVLSFLVQIGVLLNLLIAGGFN